MRTIPISASSPLRWQAAFTMKTYAAEILSPIVWQHVFVSNTPMTNWCGGSSLVLSRVVKKRPSTNQAHARSSRSRSDSVAKS